MGLYSHNIEKKSIDSLKNFIHFFCSGMGKKDKCEKKSRPFLNGMFMYPTEKLFMHIIISFMEQNTDVVDVGDGTSTTHFEIQSSISILISAISSSREKKRYEYSIFVTATSANGSSYLHICTIFILLNVSLLKSFIKFCFALQKKGMRARIIWTIVCSND